MTSTYYLCRYHKYKGRFTDLAQAYKDLEAENQKVKDVMQQTQVGGKTVQNLVAYMEVLILHWIVPVHQDLFCIEPPRLDEPLISWQDFETFRSAEVSCVLS